jgi:DNA-directed RNA polymerase
LTKNLEDIVNFDNGVLLNKAENKILFLSFCLEFIKYIQALNNKDSFFGTNSPIQLDATCNCFQHLTLLVDDLALSKELNLNESSWNDNPKDFYIYNFIAFKVKNFVDKKLDESQAGKLVLSPEDKESYKKLARLEIYRVLIKKAVMTIPYNASTSSIIEYIKENLDKQRNPNFYEISYTDTGNNKDFYIYKFKS